VPDLGGRSALVTGTAHGIGAAILRTLEEHGATAHGVDRDEVGGRDGAERSREALERIGPVDILVNNAGGVCGQVGKPL
jgi:3-oxoacyl-[acyl-carrier protein] reductase